LPAAFGVQSLMMSVWRKQVRLSTGYAEFDSFWRWPVEVGGLMAGHPGAGKRHLAVTGCVATWQSSVSALLRTARILCKQVGHARQASLVLPTSEG